MNGIEYVIVGYCACCGSEKYKDGTSQNHDRTCVWAEDRHFVESNLGSAFSDYVKENDIESAANILIKMQKSATIAKDNS
jgi:hypothetical protein